MFWTQMTRETKGKLIFISLFVLAVGQIVGLFVDGNLILHTTALLVIVVFLVVHMSIYNQPKQD